MSPTCITESKVKCRNFFDFWLCSQLFILFFEHVAVNLGLWIYVWFIKSIEYFKMAALRSFNQTKKTWKCHQKWNQFDDSTVAHPQRIKLKIYANDKPKTEKHQKPKIHIKFEYTNHFDCSVFGIFAFNSSIHISIRSHDTAAHWLDSWCVPFSSLCHFQWPTVCEWKGKRANERTIDK